MQSEKLSRYLKLQYKYLFPTIFNNVRSRRGYFCSRPSVLFAFALISLRASSLGAAGRRARGDTRQIAINAPRWRRSPGDGVASARAENLGRTTETPAVSGPCLRGLSPRVRECYVHAAEKGSYRFNSPGKAMGESRATRTNFAWFVLCSLPCRGIFSEGERARFSGISTCARSRISFYHYR